jgi:hypothetical protein
MGMNWFIGPYWALDDEGELQASGPEYVIEVTQFEAALRMRWNVINTLGFEDKKYWEVEIGKDPRSEYVFHRGATVVLERPGEHNLAEFAVWYRSLVPAEYRLVVFNDADIEDTIELNPNITYIQFLHSYGDSDFSYTIRLSSPPDLQLLERHLRGQWPSIKIYPITELDPYLFYWELLDVGDDLLQSGAVARQNPNLLLLGNTHISTIAKFALWYRQIVSMDIEMTISIPAMNNGIALRTDTTEAEIIAAVKGNWLRWQT